MEWSQAALQIDRPQCELAQQLEAGQTVRCVANDGVVVAHFDGLKQLPGWQGIQAGGKAGYHIKDTACQQCPLRALPADVLPLETQVQPGRLEVKVACARPAALAEAYHSLRRSGQMPHVRRSGRLQAAAPTVPVDLSVMTPRQRQALAVAARMGYFDQGTVGVDALGEALGCSRSTAHEHLRLGLQRLVAEVFA